MNKILKKEKGLTLIEILVVVVILSLIVGALFIVFHGGLLAYRKGTSRALVYSEARAALDMMSREISQAIVDDRRRVQFLGLHNEMHFIAPIRTHDRGDLCEVGYRLRDGILQRRFITEATDFKFNKGDQPPWSPLIGNVSSLQFRYIKDNKEYTSWHSLHPPHGPTSILPQAVRITLVMEYERMRDEVRHDTFIATVHIPTEGHKEARKFMRSEIR